MAEKPILMSGPMVRAILDNRKSQTRRVMKPQPVYQTNTTPQAWKWVPPHAKPHATASYLGPRPYCIWDASIKPMDSGASSGLLALCPYGEPGDVLWVRETWHTNHTRETVLYRADYPGCDPFKESECGEDCSLVGEKWRPSIHMPRWASRITLEVTGVRVERLQEISPEDVAAEGFRPDSDEPMRDGTRLTAAGRRMVFAEFWDSMAADGARWDDDPWVWVVEFVRV